MPALTTVTIGGRERHLRFTLGALKRLEAASGMSIVSTEFAAWSNSVTAISLLLWAGLLHEDPALRQEDLDDQLDVTDLWRIADIVRAAYAGDMPEAPGPNGSAEPGTTPTPQTVEPPEPESIGPASGP